MDGRRATYHRTTARKFNHVPPPDHHLLTMGAPNQQSSKPGTGCILRAKSGRSWEAYAPRRNGTDGELVGRFTFYREAERALDAWLGVNGGGAAVEVRSCAAVGKGLG